MLPGIIYTKRDLNQRAREIQGNHPGWIQSKNVPFQYCQSSFYPIGLVVKEIIDPNGDTFGYIKTGKGTKITSLLGKLLNFSLDYKAVSLGNLLGLTSSPSKDSGQDADKKRSPLTRLRIYRNLVTQKKLPIREADLVKALGTKHQLIRIHLETLRDYGIISQDTVEHGKSYSFYTFSDKRPVADPPMPSKNPALTRKVYKILLDYPSREWTINDVTNLLISSYQNMEKLNRKSIYTEVGRFLYYLNSLGYLTIRQFSSTQQSEINLNDDQTAMLIEFLTIIDQFQEQDARALREGEELAMGIINNPRKVSDLIKKAKENSGSANRRSPDDWYADIISVLSVHPNITSKEIADHLRERLDFEFHLNTIRSKVYKLQKSGRIASTVDNDVSYYSLKL